MHDRPLKVLHDLCHGDNPLLCPAAASASAEPNSPSHQRQQSSEPVGNFPRLRKFFGFAATDKAGHLTSRMEAKAGSSEKQPAATAAGKFLVPPQSDGEKSSDGYHGVRAFAQQGLSPEEVRRERDTHTALRRHSGQEHLRVVDVGTRNTATPFPGEDDR